MSQQAYQQTYQEAERIFEEWVANFAPRGLLHNDFNQTEIAAYLRLHFGGLVSISNLNTAVEQLGPSLQYVPVKSANELAEAQRQRWMKQHYDALNQTDDSTVQKKIEDTNAKAKAEKAETAVRATIQGEIARYECYRNGRVDYVKTEERQDYLRRLVEANAGMDQVALLAIVREKILKFPD